MSNRHSRFLTPLALLVAASPLLAQGVTAQLGGTVQSNSGQAVPGATVTIRNQETGFTRTVQTDTAGRYVATALPVGPYVVTVAKEGFQTASNIKVNLNLGDAAPLTVRLAPAASATVEVVATAAQVDTDRATAASYISPDNLTNLPVFNRSFTSLATLTPQVQVDAQRGNLAIAGQRGVNTSINIDGGDTNEPFFGGAVGGAEGATPYTISIEAIREYQVITDGASAEFGRMGGGYVNAITKSGTNDLAGSLFYYQRPQSMLALNPNLNGIPGSNAVANFQHKQYGFSVGGPIIKDKLFYFLAYDGQRRTTDVNFNWGGNSPVTLDPAANPNDGALVSRLGNYTVPANSDVYFLRLDWIVNADHAVQFRYNRSDYHGLTSTGITTSVSNSSSDDVKTDGAVLQWNWTVNSNWLNEVRVNYVKDSLPRTAASTTPQVQISDSGRTVGFYGAYPFERVFETKRLQLSETISYVTSTLQVKAGLDYNKIDIAEVFASFYRGGYTFTSLANFRSGNWATYQQLFGLNGLTAKEAGDFSAAEKQIAAFVQFDWRPVDSLKVGLGIRWDRQDHPDFPVLDYGILTPTTPTSSDPHGAKAALTGSIPDDSQISPRLSFAWTPSFDHGKTVVRGSVGRYVSTTPSVFLYQAFTANALRSASVTFSPSQAATFGIPIGAGFNANAPFSLPSSIPAGATVAAANVFTFSKDFKNPYTDRMNLGAERSFNDLVLGVTGTYARTKQLERVYDSNLSAPTLNAQGRLLFPGTGAALNRPNTYYRQMALYVSDADSIYHAYTFSAKYHKDGSAFDASLYYTYSINKDNDANERNFSSYSTANTQRLGDEWAYTDTDRRHSLTGYVSYLERRWSGIQASLSFRYTSGFPYSMTVSGDRNGDGVSGNDRLYLNGADTGRNSQRSASNTYLDLALRRDFRFTKTMKLTLSADVFNLLNRHDTYTRRSGGGTDAAPTITQTNSIVGSPRQVQLGVRFSF